MQLFSFLLLLASATAVIANPIQTPAPDPTALARRAEETTTATTATTATTTDYDPHISITVSIPSLVLDLPTNTCTPTVAPDKNGWVPADQCNALYLYYPSFAAAIAFSVLFGILMMTHFIQATIYKAGFVWVILMGVTWECVGYVVRSVSTRHQQDSTLATITQLFILLAPLWVNAFDYMVLARMIHFFIPDRRIGIFKPSLLATIFVILDFGSFVVQMVGGMMVSPGNTTAAQQNGIHIYMAGIGIQEFFIVLFLILAIQFHRQMLHLDRIGALIGVKRQWRKLLYALYSSLIFITIRIIYRLVEFSGGDDASNPIPYHEWYMYVFDAVPMLFAIMVWNVMHPGRVLHGPDAKLPPSGIRKIFCCACCCSCCKRKKNKNMQKIPDTDPVSDDTILLRERDASPYRPY